MSTVDLHRYLAVLIRWWWLLVSAAALAGLVSFLTLKPVPPTYVSSTTLMVGETFRNPKPGGNDFQTTQQLADTYAEMALRQPILEATAKALNLQTSWQALRSQVIVVHQSGSITLELRAMDIDARRARDIASGIAQQLIAASPTAANQQELADRRKFVRQELDSLQTRIQNARDDLEKKRAALARETSARGVIDRQDEIKALELNMDQWRTSYATLLAGLDDAGSPNVLAVIEPASLPTAPVGQNVPFSVALAAVAGLLLAAGVVLVIEYLDDTVKLKEDFERLIGVPALGLISRVARLRDGPHDLLVLGDPESPDAEAYRVFAANLRFTTLGNQSTLVLVTSPSQGDGKSTTAANLAAALAVGGREVLLVDLDLRNPTIHAFFAAPNDLGATTLLLEPKLELADCVLETSLPHLRLLPSGPIPPNPSELLSAFGERLIERLRGQADFVIVDSPPVLPVADTLILGVLVDGAVIVSHSGQTRRPQLRETVEALRRAKVQLLGGFLNGVPNGSLGLYRYRYPSKRTSLRERVFGRRKERQPVPLPPPGAPVST